MIVRKSREENSDTSWHVRTETNTSWKTSSRDRYKTKSRDYALGSFFDTVLTAITDPKDWLWLKIKCDPAYLEDSKYRVRIESD